MVIAIIIQARMTSTRLPGKVLKEVLGKPLLEFQIERLKQVNNVDTIILAITTNPKDDILEKFCIEKNLDYFRGPEDDVLTRYYEAAKKYNADIIVRSTSDCPIIDPGIVQNTIQYYLDNFNNFDYVANDLVRTFPLGMELEIFSFNVLKQAYNKTEKNSEREHVTPYIYFNPAKFRLGCFKNNIDYSNYRFTVDTIEDFELVKRIIEALYPVNPMFNMQDILLLLENHLDWLTINSHIEQKKV